MTLPDYGIAALTLRAIAPTWMFDPPIRWAYNQVVGEWVVRSALSKAC
jgi:hypothetical protein